MQAITASVYGPADAMDPTPGIGFAMWQDEMLASRAMARTHITQDLLLSLMNNGVGSDADWNRVGGIVRASERQNFNVVERALGSAMGSVNSTFNVAKMRDDMRNQLKAQGVR